MVREIFLLSLHSSMVLLYLTYLLWVGRLIVNYMISDGLRYYGLHDLADRIEENSRKLVNTHGLYEYYNPVTGSGAGGGYFSWTAAMCLAWLDNTN